VPSAEALARAKQFLAVAEAVCGEQLVACWLHGGSTFPDHSVIPGDADVCMVAAEAVREHGERLQAAASELDVDALFVRATDVARADRPAHAFQTGRPLVGWAVYRAHWLAGQYVSLLGREARGWVTPPSWDDLLADLDREVEHFEAHVLAGDADNPYEATVAHLNGCRVLYTMTSRDPVISKRSAGRWGLDELPAHWHPAIEAAQRCYDGRASRTDTDLLRESMPSFIEFVRDHVPVVEPRAGGPPRWT
jgi:hypothetical protein